MSTVAETRTWRLRFESRDYYPQSANVFSPLRKRGVGDGVVPSVACSFSPKWRRIRFDTNDTRGCEKTTAPSRRCSFIGAGRSLRITALRWAGKDGRSKRPRTWAQKQKRTEEEEEKNSLSLGVAG